MTFESLKTLSKVEDLMVFSIFRIGGVYKNPDELKGGETDLQV